MNHYLKQLLSILSILIISYIGIYIHELGHYTVATWFGLEAEIHFNLFTNSYTMVEHTDNITEWRLILIAGSLFACIFGFILIIADYIIRTDCLIWGGWSVILGNCIYWMMINFVGGDVYFFITTFNNYNYILHFTVITLLLILTTITLYTY